MTKSRQTLRFKNRFFVAIAIFALALVSWKFFPAPGQAISEAFLRPLLKGESALNRLAGNSEPVLSPDELSELDYLRAENVSLRAVLGDTDETRIAAGVIGRPTALPYDVLVLDKGSSDGILMDTPVFVKDNTVIGFVVTTYQHSSVVALTSTPGFTSTVYIYGPNIYTTAVGIGGGVTRIHVPQGIELSIGDTVVIPSLSKGVYGSIGAVDSVPELPEQYGYVTSDVPINSLRVVSVGTKPLSVVDFETARQTIENAKRDFLMVDVPSGMLIDVGTVTTSTSTPADMASTTENVNP